MIISIYKFKPIESAIVKDAKGIKTHAWASIIAATLSTGNVYSDS